MGLNTETLRPTRRHRSLKAMGFHTKGWTANRYGAVKLVCPDGKERMAEQRNLADPTSVSVVVRGKRIYGWKVKGAFIPDDAYHNTYALTRHF